MSVSIYKQQILKLRRSEKSSEVVNYVHFTFYIHFKENFNSHK